MFDYLVPLFGLGLSLGFVIFLASLLGLGTNEVVNIGKAMRLAPDAARWRQYAGRAIEVIGKLLALAVLALFVGMVFYMPPMKPYPIDSVVVGAFLVLCNAFVWGLLAWLAWTVLRAVVFAGKGWVMATAIRRAGKR